MIGRREDLEAERARRAAEILAAVDRDAEVMGTSGFARTITAAGDRLARHFGAADADADDRIEVWGRRIARALALAAAVALLLSVSGLFGR